MAKWNLVATGIKGAEDLVHIFNIDGFFFEPVPDQNFTADHVFKIFEMIGFTVPGDFREFVYLPGFAFVVCHFQKIYERRRSFDNRFIDILYPEMIACNFVSTSFFIII